MGDKTGSRCSASQPVMGTETTASDVLGDVSAAEHAARAQRRERPGPSRFEGPGPVRYSEKVT
jgi:hypothetical protein